MKNASPLERQEQAWLFNWAKLQAGRFPELHDLYASANGGKRSKLTAVMLRSAGVKPGIPDVHLPVGRGGYLSLYIEMKRKDATPSDTSPEQLDWHTRLRKDGNCVLVCKGFDVARESIMLYLAGGYKRPFDLKCTH